MPAYIDDLPVTEVSGEFTTVLDRDRLVLPQTLKRIGEGAFTGMTLADLGIMCRESPPDMTTLGTVPAVVSIDIRIAELYKQTAWEQYNLRIGFPIPMHESTLVMDYNIVTRRAKPYLGNRISSGDKLVDAMMVHIDDVPEGAKVSVRIKVDDSLHTFKKTTHVLYLEYDPIWDVWMSPIPEDINMNMRGQYIDVQVCIEYHRYRELSFNTVRVFTDRAIIC